MAFTHKHILRGPSAAPLIYHVFNVEQDQVIRDSQSSIFGLGMAQKDRERETKASQSHELSRWHPQVQPSCLVLLDGVTSSDG